MIQLNNIYARACKFSDNKQICTCDFRINIYHCDQSDFLIGGTWLTLILNLSIAFLCVIVLYYLIKIKNLSIWFPATRERGILRYLNLHLILLLTNNVNVKINLHPSF